MFLWMKNSAFEKMHFGLILICSMDVTLIEDEQVEEHV